jgi:hypothetical protein
LKEASGALAVSGAAIIYQLCRDSANADLVNLSACRVLVSLLSTRQPVRQQHSSVSSAASRPFKKKKDSSSLEDESAKIYDSVVKRLIPTLPTDTYETKPGSHAPAESSDLACEATDSSSQSEISGWEPEEVTAENLSFLSCSHLTMQHPSFRELFRQAGGIPTVVKILMDSMLALILSLELGDSERPAMRRMRRDLRLIESLTFMSAENQSIVMQNECFVPELVKLLDRLTRLLQDVDWLGGGRCRGVANEIRLGALKVLVNLTNHNPTGGTQVGKADGIPAIVAMLRACSTAKGVEDYDAVTLGIGNAFTRMSITDRTGLTDTGKSRTAHQLRRAE